MLHNWELLESKELAKYKVFGIRADRKRFGRTGTEHTFYLIESPDWVNVVAVTRNHELVMVEQYRHGSGTVELEIPGGIIDPGDGSPEAAAARELAEETGYVGEVYGVISWVYANPAIMTNRAYTVLVTGCEIQEETKFDPTEDLVTRLIPIEQINSLVISGAIRHPLVLVALYNFDLLLRSGRLAI
jgi:8-oxo-dGTP pyrophosphatase MutT (NUDIX family)